MAENCNMTRKTRTRQTRIRAALQSGYCAICHLPYNSLDEHIQSKKHSKLIGEDANYISINGFIDQSTIEPFLNLNGIDSIDINGRNIEMENSYSPRVTRRCAAKNKTFPSDSKKLKIDHSRSRSPLSPTGSEVGHHRLRSRKQINYAMSPTLDEDSISEKIEFSGKTEKETRSASREHRETRSSTRLTNKLSEPIENDVVVEECWNSGRPKRSSTAQHHKRVSADERLVVDNKTYYKVEVMSAKLRSSSIPLRESDHVRNHATITEPVTEKTDKGLIVKFRKMRNSELTQLNNEAENFLFPKKEEDSSDEDEGGTDTGEDTTASTNSNCVGGGSKRDDDSSSDEDSRGGRCKLTRFKVEDEDGSMDSTCSGKKRKRRGTHAEAFIRDNQKYYKFETPGSRLRYQGSIFPDVEMKSPKTNGDLTLKKEHQEPPTEEKECKKVSRNLNDYQFSFERVPTHESWYEVFRRQDLGQEKYINLNDSYKYNHLILPYQIGPLPPLDPQECISHAIEFKKAIMEALSPQNSGASCSTSELSETADTPSTDGDGHDEDSKTSGPSEVSEAAAVDEEKPAEPAKRGRKRKAGAGKNPRKSPRQHASTLAILSSLIEQRKRKSSGGGEFSKDSSLCTIPEEEIIITNDLTKIGTNLETYDGYDYEEIAREFEEKCNAKDNFDLEDLVVEVDDVDGMIEFKNEVGVMEVIRQYEESKAKEEPAKKLIVGSLPPRKVGRRKKKNRTGWPNRKRLLGRPRGRPPIKNKDSDKNEEDENSTNDSNSVKARESGGESPNPPPTDSISKKRNKKIVVVNKKKLNSVKNNHKIVKRKKVNCDYNSDRVIERKKTKIKPPTVKKKVVIRVAKSPKRRQTKDASNAIAQQRVSVKKCRTKTKIEECGEAKSSESPKRTNIRQRRMPASPKSPRLLRKPRGRWYKER